MPKISGTRSWIAGSKRGLRPARPLRRLPSPASKCENRSNRLLRVMEENNPAEPVSALSPAMPKKRSVVGALMHWLRDLIFSVVLAVIVILFLYQPVKVEGTSMMPALTDQERIFINKFVYRFHFGDIERGDMVVFWYPGDPSKSYIKRVIGVPGDRIEIDRGTVVLNGKALVENYVP